MSQKVTNDAAAYIRSLAERWGRNADWAERAVRQSVSVPAAEAVSLHDADLEAPTRSALFRSWGSPRHFCPTDRATGCCSERRRSSPRFAPFACAAPS